MSRYTLKEVCTVYLMIVYGIPDSARYCSAFLFQIWNIMIINQSISVLLGIFQTIGFIYAWDEYAI